MPTPYETDQDAYAQEAPVSLSHFVNVIRRYSGVIVLSLAAVFILYAIVAAAALLLAPSQKVTTLPFRLEFDGAARGEYPNGLKFSVADITAAPALLDVYRTNDLARFVTFDQFARSLFVVEANRELEKLTAEYQVKLADPKLTAVDRDKLERDFESRRESISKSDFAIQFVGTDKTSRIPPTVIRKTLNDVLASWARRTAVEKRGLDYPVLSLSANILNDAGVSASGGDAFVPLLLVRRRADELIRNISDIERIPGATLIRTRAERTSLSEIRIRLEEIIRYRIEPLISTARASGLLGSPAVGIEILRAQLTYDERLLMSAQMKETALRNTLAMYQSALPSSADQKSGAMRTPAGGPASSAGETVMPQLGDTFLDRLVDLTNNAADRDFRQKMTDEIKAASLAAVPLDAAVKYDNELIASLQAPPAGGLSLTSAEFQKQFSTVLESVRAVAGQLNEIYITASRQLYPETELFRTLGPPVTRSERAISPMRLLLAGVLTMLIALPLVIIFALLHNRVREEESDERITHESAVQPGS